MSQNHTALVDKMWAALLRDPNFVPMIEEWDKLCETEGVDDKGKFIAANARLKKDFERLDAAFRAAIQANEAAASTDFESVNQDWIRITNEGRSVEISRSLKRKQINSESLLEAIQDQEKTQYDSLGRLLIWASLKTSKLPILLSLTPGDKPKATGHFFYVESIDLEWQATIEPILEKLFSLSASEVSVVSQVYAGFDSSEIATKRNRSVFTVRTQIKTAMEKMGVSNQREMVKLLSSISYFHTQVEPNPPRPSNHAKVFISHNGFQHSYYDYGPRDGQVVFLISTTVSPAPNSHTLGLTNKHKLRVIAVVRPGSEQTSKRPIEHAPQVLCEEYTALLEHLNINDFAVVGYASGGVYACAMAQKVGQRCKALITIDTGHPLTNIGQIIRMPKVARRTFMVARYTPNLLLAPHKIAANDFQSGAKGVERMIAYFFDQQPHDLERTRNTPFFYECTKALLAFSFEDTDRLVADVSYWAKDWSPFTKKLSPNTKKIAVIGDHNLNFDHQQLKKWCKANQWHTNIFKDEGQLLVFSKTDELFALVSKSF